MARTKYEVEVKGLRELGASAAVGQACVDAGRAIAAAAKADNPSGVYSVSPTTVVSGWANERRAGAQVVEERVGAGRERRSLARAVAGVRS